ncbi:MAG: hypothetical protein HYX27_19980 [Acidobacteria bacterium]|nr:hypothetical protein [Acidobacteriota bacterium]
MRIILWLSLAVSLFAQKETVNLSPGVVTDDHPQLLELLKIRRLYVEKLAGGDTAVQIRDMLIGALQGSRLFSVTENPEKADTILRGSAEDLVFTDVFQSSEGLHARSQIGSTRTTTASRGVGLSVGENESVRIAERKHEATVSVRLVSKDGDVIWSTTQESLGAKFRGASADVAAKVTRQLTEDYARARRLSGAPLPAPSSAAMSRP